MSDYTPSLATAREVFIDGAQGEFLGEDFDRMIVHEKAEALREFAHSLPFDIHDPRYIADLARGVADHIEKEAE